MARRKEDAHESRSVSHFSLTVVTAGGHDRCHRPHPLVRRRRFGLVYLPFRRKYLDMHRVDFDFSELVCLLDCEDLGFARVDFEPLRFFFFLKSAVIF